MYATAMVGALLLAVAAYKLIKRALGGLSADSTEIDDLRKKAREQFAVGDPSFREGNTPAALQRMHRR
jgi:hypothetical protein